MNVIKRLMSRRTDTGMKLSDTAVSSGRFSGVKSISFTLGKTTRISSASAIL